MPRHAALHVRPASRSITRAFADRRRSSPGSPSPCPARPLAGPSDDDAQAVVDHYAAGVHAAYEASLESATELDAAIDAFLADPTDETLEAAKQAWLTARDDYGLTEAFRFYGGPIDNETDGPEGLINAWPLDEAYIDYVEGDPAAGVVNDPDTYPTIDAELITSLNEQGGEANISTGWHAIEFLLWGQDLSTDGPGERPVTDYTTADNADRRGTYLAVTSDLLLEHLTGLVEAWAPDAENYRAEFVGRRSHRGADDDPHRHRRADPRRAGRRADVRGLRAALAGGRALVLLRQHDRRPAGQRPGHRHGAHRRVPGRRRRSWPADRSSRRPTPTPPRRCARRSTRASPISKRSRRRSTSTSSTACPTTTRAGRACSPPSRRSRRRPTPSSPPPHRPASRWRSEVSHGAPTESGASLLRRESPC